MREPWVSWLEETLGQEVERCRPVAGGCIHRAWALELAGGGRLFAKTNLANQLPALEAEMEGLLALASAAGAELVVPMPMHCALAGSQALLVMDWLDMTSGGPGLGVPPAAAAEADLAWESAGAALARLHRRSSASGSPGFGWQRDNFIGSATQRNRWSQDWGNFFSEQRLGPQLKLAERSGRLLRGSRRLLELTPEWLNGHGAVPCLVHGDLWGGNAARMAPSSITQGSAEVALFDPAVYRGTGKWMWPWPNFSEDSRRSSSAATRGMAQASWPFPEVPYLQPLSRAEPRQPVRWWLLGTGPIPDRRACGLIGGFLAVGF